MPCKGVGKNGYKPLADSCQRVPRDVTGNDVFDILVAGKYVSAVGTVSGFEQGITDEVDAFVMTFEEHRTFLYYLKPSLDYHRALFVKCPPAPSFIALGKPFPYKADSFSTA